MKKKLLLLLYLHFLGVVEVPYIRSITTIVLKGEKKDIARSGWGMVSSHLLGILYEEEEKRRQQRKYCQYVQ